ncbi:MAG: hypothetical protein J4G13_13420 [Dehalococcoidia bacterium]|nr:hypothetical protein [Dehalococcoidia bacterium]
MQETSVRAPQIVTTPTFDWLAERATMCKSRILIASPYVNDAVVNLTDLSSSGVAKIIVTKTDLRDFRVGASNLDSLRTLAQKGAKVRSLHNLHAKVYVFDETTALVTSANATFGGMRRNWECGLAIEDRQSVSHLANLVLSGFGSDAPPRAISFAELNRFRATLPLIDVSIPTLPADDFPADEPPTLEAVFSVPDKEQLLDQFTGWLQLTLRGVLEMPESGFGMQQLFAICQPVAAVEYPDNHNVEAKLRQQLQFLRDRGFVEFISPGQGRYRFTMPARDAYG